MVDERCNGGLNHLGLIHRRSKLTDTHTLDEVQTEIAAIVL